MNKSYNSDVLKLLEYYGTQDALADVMGVTQGAVSRLLRQENRPHGSTQRLIDRLLKEKKVSI